MLAAELTPDAVQGRAVRVSFQDEARFGRMARMRRCWAPAPWRPRVRNGYERQFTSGYGAVSSLQGQLDWRLSPHMTTEHMGAFLHQVSEAHPEDFILMVFDGASSHKAKGLTVPENVRLLPLPPYSPELNPQEHLWGEIREKEFPNRVMDNMEEVIRQLQDGLARLASDADRLRSLSAWPWIIRLNLKAN